MRFQKLFGPIECLLTAGELNLILNFVVLSIKSLLTVQRISGLVNIRSMSMVISREAITYIQQLAVMNN